MDYERFGKQIALPELGLEGQSLLAAAAVRFDGPEESAARAEAIWRLAGGSLAPTPGGTARTVTIPAHPVGPCASLGLAAWAAITAARETLGWGPTPASADLLAALDPHVKTVE
jgi:hypothetical protein